MVRDRPRGDVRRRRLLVAPDGPDTVPGLWCGRSTVGGGWEPLGECLRTERWLGNRAHRFGRVIPQTLGRSGAVVEACDRPTQSRSFQVPLSASATTRHQTQRDQMPHRCIGSSQDGGCPPRPGILRAISRWRPNEMSRLPAAIRVPAPDPKALSRGVTGVTPETNEAIGPFTLAVRFVVALVKGDSRAYSLLPWLR
jgi:hypothetical protein